MLGLKPVSCPSVSASFRRDAMLLNRMENGNSVILEASFRRRVIHAANGPNRRAFFPSITRVSRCGMQHFQTIERVELTTCGHNGNDSFGFQNRSQRLLQADRNRSISISNVFSLRKRGYRCHCEESFSRLEPDLKPGGLQICEATQSPAGSPAQPAVPTRYSLVCRTRGRVENRRESARGDTGTRRASESCSH